MGPDPRDGNLAAGLPGGSASFVRVEVPFFGFDGRYHRGALVVNRDIATDTREVFDHLAAAKFPLNTVIPVEYFGGLDRVSEAANNTSAFNCRKPAEGISAPESSPHANGRAFDLNPVQNPWIRPGTTTWEPAAGAIWATRRELAWQRFGVVAAGGIPLTWFTNRGGWQWQGGPVDYMHFDTGFPSVPMSGH